MKIFIYANWEKVCKALARSCNTIRADEILECSSNTWITIKHDVETDVSKALKLAEIEHQYDIRATYYVQGNLLEGNITLLKQIAALGHEVSYHYDVLDACDGDYAKAIENFTKYKNKFEDNGFYIKTVCPHGNPIKVRNGWNSNKDFFREKSVNMLFPEVLDIVVHLPNRLNKTYTYISDAGYAFQEIANIHNNDTLNHGDIKIDGDFIDYLKTKKRIILSTHPHRWESSKFKFMFQVYRFKMIRSVAKRLAKITFLKRIMSKYYYLAKKV